MHPRAQELIDELGLQPHPEGGFYREVFRSTLAVTRAETGAVRTALTSIDFLLPRGAVSRWHQVLGADEAWHHHEGAPLRLLDFPPHGGACRSTTLGPVAVGSAPVQVVPAGHWQAAETLGDFSLLGCSVGPGFEFADFRLLADHPEPGMPMPDGLPQWRALL
jgi:predicted cupin superfamily sugar epimerase